MKLKVKHTNIYSYKTKVYPETHIIRLYPKVNISQMVEKFSISIEPEPSCLTKYIDFEGNIVFQAWFRDLTGELAINTDLEIISPEYNIFDFFLEPLDLKLPFTYPHSEHFSPYLKTTKIVDDEFYDFTNNLAKNADNNIINFLMLGCESIHNNFKYKVRENGDPYPAEYTFQHKSGSCRDFAVFFAEICRYKGLASRFVSGYKYCEKTKDKENYLHAWVEVYLPGAGWRGFDPTMGLGIDNNYIALASSADYKNAAPITGSYRGKSSKHLLHSQINICAF